MNVAFRIAPAALAISPLLMMVGCGLPSAPLPPSLKLPEPVTDLTAVRHGDEVRLHWTMPKRTTDKVLLKGAQQAHICRQIGTGPCETAADQPFDPAAPADFADHLPPADASGPPRLMTYTIELLNHAGHNAGPSNRAITAAGAAPPRVEGLTATAQPEGILLRWQPAAGTDLVRIHRELVEKPGAPKPSQTGGSPAPLEQTLEVTSPDKGLAIDRDAALDHTYRYSAERVQKLTLDGNSFEVLSAPGIVITIDARDVFPPAVPRELQAVADSEAHAIDLSWAPNSESDLAGYIVYRRDTASNEAAARISPPNEVAPSFRDVNAHPGHRYAYSVSAIDRDGNESPRSAETEESLPQP
jgi:hypothetical protein